MHQGEPTRPCQMRTTGHVRVRASRLVRLDVGTGKRLRAAPTKSRILSSPAAVDGVVYVGSDDHKVYALGTRRWTMEGPHTSLGGIQGGAGPFHNTSCRQTAGSGWVYAQRHTAGRGDRHAARQGHAEGLHRRD